MTKNTSQAEEIKPAEDWMQRKWRPMMGWQYMFVCVFDFVLFPILFTIVQFWEIQPQNDAFRQWIPITLSNGGLYHLAMGAVLGITAWSRGQEKMAGVSISTPINSGMTVGNAEYSPSMSTTGVAMTRTYDSVTPITPITRESAKYSKNNYATPSPNLEKMRQHDPDNIFERG